MSEKRRPLSKRWPGQYVYVAKLRAPNGYILEVEMPLSIADGKAMQVQMLELVHKHLAPGTSEVSRLIRHAASVENRTVFDEAGEMLCHSRIAATE